MKEGFTVVEQLSIPSTFESMPIVEQLIDKVCSLFGVVENYGNILIAVTEAVNNAIIHGNTITPDLPVKLSVAEDRHFFCFSVADNGKGFDFSTLPDPTAPENIEKENGRGIFLMKNLSDELEFNQYGNDVTIYFKK